MLGFGSIGELALGEIPPQQSAQAVAEELAQSRRRKAMYPGGWVPENLHSPPRRKLKQKAVEALKELYEEARETIPDDLQHGLLPPDVFLGRIAIGLPAHTEINFDALARSLKTIRVLVAAIEAQAQARKAQAAEEATRKRRSEEEALIMILMEML